MTFDSKEQRELALKLLVATEITVSAGNVERAAAEVGALLNAIRNATIPSEEKDAVSER